MWRSMVNSGIAQASQDPSTDFNSGAALSYLDSTAGLAGHESAAKFQVGTAFLPQGPAGFGCCTGGSGLAITSATADTAKQQAAMKFIAYATGADTVFWSQNTGYMPVRQAALDSQEMQTFYQQHPNFKTTVDQLPKTRPQDAARELVPNGDQIIGDGLARIITNGEAADVVFKDVADQLDNEKQPVLRSLKDLGEN
jgi:sn-glycerol 3-phosphate transport system substrate-binding protein